METQRRRQGRGAQAPAQATRSSACDLVHLSDKLTQRDKGWLLSCAQSWLVGARLALGELGAEGRVWKPLSPERAKGHLHSTEPGRSSGLGPRCHSAA